MSKIDIEAQYMTKKFSTPLSDEWYENIILPISWQLISGRMKNKKILDIGCATGWVSWWARKEGADVIASDIFSTHVHPSLPFVLCSKSNLPFPNETFDMVLTANVLHHGELDKTTIEIKRVLKKGGEFVTLQEPCIDNNLNERKYLESNLSNELNLGIDERRPSLKKYKKALNIFSLVEFYQMGDPMFVKPISKSLILITGNNYSGGIAIKAIK